MATLVLGAVGAAVGGSIGGSVIGLSGAVIGRAVGATLGRAIDQRVMGAGSDVIEHGRLDRLRLGTASEGVAIPRAYGRVRLPGQVIWTTPYREVVETTGGGKGGPPKPKVREYSYRVSLAIALCEGPVERVGRVWADGRELARDEVAMRVYRGGEDQLPDPLIEAEEGAESAPAYRGVAYVVLEDLELGPFGNRVPQFSFEVVRAARVAGQPALAQDLIRGVALIPGTGEFSLSTTRIEEGRPLGRAQVVNVNSPAEASDLDVAVTQLVEELPALRSASLVVSWFGDDLRCGDCTIRPKVGARDVTTRPFDWAVSGLSRTDAREVPRVDGASIYGGTPSDMSVIEAIRRLGAEGLDVTYYPFILMDQLPGNGLPDPNGAAEQPTMPWRGRITTSIAPGRAGSPDRSAAAREEIDRFFGTARAEDFAVTEHAGVRSIFAFDNRAARTEVSYAGPEDWGYRRFVLHQAALCAAAGGVEAFCIGSEMVALTQVRGPGDTFPAVEQLRALAAEVRKLLPGAKIGYAADWTEYFGYHPQDGSGDLFFHLDPLWADPEIDFVGIDNYKPLADWRDGDAHADAGWGTTYDLGYLQSNIEGGEGYDWYYPSPEARDAQRRVPITDGAYAEPWVWRYKDLRAWWGNRHHERRGGGVRAASPTAWRPGLKPVRFTEYGCAAVDKGANQPNKFVDLRSSESGLPHYSGGTRDDVIQMQYARALLSYWGAPGRNPISDEYGGRMLDLDHSFVWAWDARPWPWFPANRDAWADAVNHAAGHWWTGRSASQPLASVIADICASAELGHVDVSRVHGVVRGYAIREVQSARGDLQPLLLAHGVEAAERGGTLVFVMRERAGAVPVGAEEMVREDEAALTTVRSGEGEGIGRVRVHHVDAADDFDIRVAEAAAPGRGPLPETDTEVPLSLTRGEGIALAERFLAEAGLARDAIRLALPPSRRGVTAGSLIAVEGLAGVWRVDRIEEAGARRVDAVRADPSVFRPSREGRDDGRGRAYQAAGPVTTLFLDLPLLRVSDAVQAPYVAVAADPFPGPVAVLSSSEDAGYEADTFVERSATVGLTETALARAPAGLIDRGPGLAIRFADAALSSVSMAGLLAGRNALALGTGAPDGWEILQFRSAVPVDREVWRLSGLLRGQRGTEALIRDPWPVGSVAVLLDSALRPIDRTRAVAGVERHFRIGPARFAPDHPTWDYRTLVPRDSAAAPFAPAHLRHRRDGTTDRFSWVRRSRVDGGSWEIEPPLGESRERYAVRARVGSRIGWRAEVDEPAVALSAAARAAGDLDGGYVFEVAQISETYGPGRWAAIGIT